MTRPMDGTPYVDVDFPADARFLVMARVTVAALAAELGFDLEAIDDLRIAADELCVALLPEAADDSSRIHLRAVLDGSAILVEGAIDRDGPDVPREVASLDELSRSILEVIVDSYQFGPGTFRFRKSRP
jgi:anti-sigma regulatory factor (Ser/Thr protein kinase)